MPFPTTSPPLARALAERNYEQPTPVQLAVLADDAVGRDLLVSAQTGSGKTVAYGLAMARDLLGDAERGTLLDTTTFELPGTSDFLAARSMVWLLGALAPPDDAAVAAIERAAGDVNKLAQLENWLAQQNQKGA